MPFTPKPPRLGSNGTTAYVRIGGIFPDAEYDASIPPKDREQKLTKEGYPLFRLSVGDVPIDCGNDVFIPEHSALFVALKPDGNFQVVLGFRRGAREKFQKVYLGETSLVVDYETKQPKPTEWGATQWSVRLNEEKHLWHGVTLPVGFEVTFVDNQGSNPPFWVETTTRQQDGAQPHEPNAFPQQEEQVDYGGEFD